MRAIGALAANLFVIEQSRNGYEVERSRPDCRRLERVNGRMAHGEVVEAAREDELAIAPADRRGHDVVEHEVAASDPIARNAELVGEEIVKFLCAFGGETEDRRQVLLLVQL